jgi:hypothetical protein
MGPRAGLGDVSTVHINYFFGINVIIFVINVVAT